MFMENVYVVYVGVANFDDIDVSDYISKLSEKIMLSSIKGEYIFIPRNTYDTHIECINPKYITNESLIFEHTKKMIELNTYITELQIRNFNY